MNVDLSVIPQNQLSGLRQANPGAFAQPFAQMVQTGRNLQWLGSTGVEWAVAEQKLTNDTLFTASETKRLEQFNELNKSLREPGVFNPKTFEGDMLLGIAKINKGLEAEANNPLVATQIRQSGEAFLADKTSGIQKEARVFRLKALQAQGLNNVRTLRQTLINTTNPVEQKALRETLEDVLTGMTSGNILDPLAAQKELDSLDKDLQDAGIRRVISTATSFGQIEEVVAKADQLSAEEKEMLLATGERSLRARISAKNAAEDRKHRIGERERKERYRKNENNFNIAMHSDTPPSLHQLKLALDRDDISDTAFNRFAADLRNPPEADRETDVDSYNSVLNKIKANPPEIDEDEIRFHKGLSNADRNSFVQRLNNRLSTDKSKTLTQSEKLMNRVIGDAAVISKYAAAARKREAKVLWKEFDERVKDGEDPDVVAKDITDRWLQADDPESGLAQNRMARKRLALPKTYQRHFTKSPNGINVPDTAAMEDQALDDLDSRQITPGEFAEIVEQIRDIEDVFPEDEQLRILPPPPPIEQKVEEEEEQDEPITLKNTKAKIVETGKKAVAPIEAQAREFQPIAKEAIQSMVEPVKKSIQGLKEAVSDSESGPETLNRLATEALEAIGVIDTSPKESSTAFTAEDMFNLALTDKDLQNKADFPDDFLLQKYRELFFATDPDEVALFEKLEAEVRRRGLPEG